MPSRLQVRITRQAISPRLAIRILSNSLLMSLPCSDPTAPSTRRYVPQRSASRPSAPRATMDRRCWSARSRRSAPATSTAPRSRAAARSARAACAPRASGALPSASQRDVAVLAPRIVEALVLQRLQRLADPPPRAVRHDHVIDEAAVGRHERIGELLPVLLGARRDLGGFA